MDKSSFGVHEVKLVVQMGPCLFDCSGVRKATNSAMYLSQVTSWDNSGWLIVDPNLEEKFVLNASDILLLGLSLL